jgi:hypothetical protein
MWMELGGILLIVSMPLQPAPDKLQLTHVGLPTPVLSSSMLHNHPTYLPCIRLLRVVKDFALTTLRFS